MRKPASSQARAPSDGLTWFRSSLWKPTLAIGGTVVALVACEALSRVLGTAPEVIAIGITSQDCSYRRSTNPYLSYELKPNYENSQADIKFDHPRINSHGQRDIERTFERAPGVKRVLLLGDSVVVGFGVREIDDLMSRQLEALYPSGKVEVLNMAVSGYCTRAELELLKTKGLRYRPDVVILVFVENDFHNFNREARTTDGVAMRPPLVGSLFATSHLFRTACLRFNLFGFGMETDPARWNQQAIGENNVVDGLRMLRELALRHSFETLVLAWPAFTNRDIKYNDVMLMAPGSSELIIERLARSFGLTCERLDLAFRADWKVAAAANPALNPRTYYTVGDEMHPSIVGHRVTAGILYDRIRALALLKNSDGPPSTVTKSAIGEDVEAIQAALALGTEKSDYGAVKFNLGKEMLKQGDEDAALAAFRETLSVSDRYDVDAHVEIGVIEFGRGKVDEAVNHYRLALATDPNNYFANVNMGNALRVQKQLALAVQHYHRAIQLRPEQLEAHYNLAATLASLNKVPEAIAEFQIAARIQPKDTRVLDRLGRLFESSNRHDEAVSVYERLISIEADNADIQNRLGVVQAKLGELDRAVLRFERAVEIEPENHEYHFNLGKALSGMNRLPEAVAALQRSIRLSPSHAAAWNSLGVALAKSGEMKRAAEMFAKALEIDPDFADARRNLSNAR